MWSAYDVLGSAVGSRDDLKDLPKIAQLFQRHLRPMGGKMEPGGHAFSQVPLACHRFCDVLLLPVGRPGLSWRCWAGTAESR